MLSLLAAAAVCQAPPRPNIVMIFSDDHARRAISAYGSRLIATPNIDRIAQEGVRFDRHYTANPICAPSRATLLTGKYSHLNGIKDNASTFDGSQETFPKLLQAAGYKTAFIGKWHLASDPTGFDHWEVLPGQGAYYNPDFLTPRGRVTEHGYVTEIISKKAVDWLETTDGKPFCLLVGHKAPHRNWVPGPKQMALFNDRTFPEPPTLRTGYEGLATAAKSVRMRLDQHIRPAADLLVDTVPPRMDEAQRALWKQAMAQQDASYRSQLESSGDLLGTNYQRYLKNYLRCVAAVDESVGEIYGYLNSRGLLKNTVLIYASDQGFFLGENGWYDKRWFYEPSAGTPLVVRPAGGARRSKAMTVGSLTSNVDLAPTLLDLAGVAVPKTMQGTSLKAMLNGRGARSKDSAVYGHFYESDDGDHKAPKYVAVTTARHKLIYYYEQEEWELFDLSQDPNETRNLWLEGASGTVKAEMRRKLLSRMRELEEEEGLIQSVERAARITPRPFLGGALRHPSSS
ncbi:MAG: sulfatase [Armatimonadetes bacterium]|nr:sulfatase [Armatimonadota bacterium]